MKTKKKISWESWNAKVVEYLSQDEEKEAAIQDVELSESESQFFFGV